MKGGVDAGGVFFRTCLHSPFPEGIRNLPRRPRSTHLCQESFCSGCDAQVLEIPVSHATLSLARHGRSQRRKRLVDGADFRQLCVSGPLEGFNCLLQGFHQFYYSMRAVETSRLYKHSIVIAIWYTMDRIRDSLEHGAAAEGAPTRRVVVTGRGQYSSKVGQHGSMNVTIGSLTLLFLPPVTRPRMANVVRSPACFTGGRSAPLCLDRVLPPPEQRDSMCGQAG
jgi:hypothetical protein